MLKKIVFLSSVIALFSMVGVIQSVPYWNWNNQDIQNVVFPERFSFGVSVFSREVARYDHLGRYKEDLKLAQETGAGQICFSLDWDLIEPYPGVFNEEELQRYVDFCIESIERGIEPVVILKDYNDPAWFLECGGFEKRANIVHFQRYCLKVFTALKGKVYRFITFWSPESYAMLAYWNRSHPPYKKDMQLAMDVFQNQLDAHVRVYNDLKSADDEHKIQIGIAKHVIQLEPKYPWDRLATSMADTLTNEPFYKFFTTGKFNVSVRLPKAWGGVKKRYKNSRAPQSIDFIGINYHCHNQMRNFKRIAFAHEPATDIESITVYPEGLYYAVKEVSDKMALKLNIPIIVTQNGIATKDNNLRTLHNQRNLYALAQAIDDGYNVQGYYHYCLIDGLAWGSYDKQFGLFAVDPVTKERSLKPGAHYFIQTAKKHKEMYQ